VAKTEQDYRNLQGKLAAIEAQYPYEHPLHYLADEGVDMENAECVIGTDEYWSMMLDSACMAAGQRASEGGYDINKLIGRVIY
jgi:hypothetical protein